MTVKRLPVDQADDDVWGPILNTWLTVPDTGARYVDPAGDDGNTGLGPNEPFATVQAAYDDLPDPSGSVKGGGTIVLANASHNVGTGLIFDKRKPVVLTSVSGRTHRFPGYTLPRTDQENAVLYSASGPTQLVEIKQPTGTVVNGYGFQFRGIVFDMTDGSDYGIYAENVGMCVVEDCGFFGPEPQTEAQWGIRCKKVVAHGDDSSWWRILNNNTNRVGLVYAGDGAVSNNTNQFVVAHNVVIPGTQVDSCIRLEGGHRIFTFANNVEPGTATSVYGLRFESCSGAMAIGDSGEASTGAVFLRARSCNGCTWMPVGYATSTDDTDKLVDDDSSSNMILSGALTGQGSLYDSPEYSHLTRTGFAQAPVIGPNGMSWPGIIPVPTKLSNSVAYLHPEPYDMVPAQTLTYEYWTGSAWAAWAPTDGKNPTVPNSDYLLVDDTHKRWRVKLSGIGNPDLGVLMVRAFGTGSYSGTFNVTVEDLSGADAVQATHGPFAYTMTSTTEGFVVPLGFVTGSRLRIEVDFSFLTGGQSMRVSRLSWYSHNNIRNRDYGGRLMRGAGTPEAAVTGRVGDVYLRLDGAVGTSMYVKESGTGNTGWGAYGGTLATNTLWDAKGDLAVATGPDAATRLAVGTNNQVLTADSAQATGVKWAAASATVAKGTATFLVASNGALQSTKDRADYVCDGTADNVEIQAALDALPTGGGRVLLSGGQFNLAARVRVEKDSTTLQGLGTGVSATDSRAAAAVGTRLVAATGLTSQVLLVQRAAADRALYGVTLRDFTIDGNDVGTAVDGVLFRADTSVIDNIHIWNTSGSGLVLRGLLLSEGATADSYLFDCRASNIYVNGCTLDGIRALNLVYGVQFTNVAVRDVARDGFYTDSSASHNAFVNLTVVTSGRYGLHFNGGGAYNRFTNARVFGAANHLVVLDSTTVGQSGLSFVNCAFLQSGLGVANTYDCMILQRSSGTFRYDNLGISDCHFGTFSGNLARYGFNCTYGGLAEIRFVGNNLRAAEFGTGTATFGTPAAGSVVQSNMGFVTRSGGVSTQTPGAVTTVNIAHGMAATPTTAIAFPANAATRNVPLPYMVTISGANIVLTYSAALTAATSYSWNWQAEAVF